MTISTKTTFSSAVAAMILVATPLLADVQAGLDQLNAGDPDAAIIEFQKAVEAGDGDGAFYLGRLVELSPQPNVPEAVAFYTQGSEAGSALAKNRLGLMYLEGASVLQDFEEGTRLVCEAADQGDANGQFNCALTLLDSEDGEGTAAKAIAYAQKAAEQKHIGAMNLLGQSYITGTGVEPNDKTAAEFFQQTAALGNPVGLFSLGQAYALGIGLDRDLVKAHAYFNLAAANGHPDALQARQAVEGELERSQVIEAQRYARAWRPIEETTTEATE